MKKKNIIFEKKERKINKIFIIILFMIFNLILIFRSFDDPIFTSLHKIFFFIILTVLEISLILFKKNLSKFIINKRIDNIYVFSEILFKYYIFPFMILSIILLGALDQKYPAGYYPNGTFEQNSNASIQSVMNITSTALQKTTTTIYTTGKSNPNIYIMIIITFIILIPIFVIPSLYRLKKLEYLDAQELIDSINKKDYEDLEKYEKNKTNVPNFVKGIKLKFKPTKARRNKI